jgi:hypothetical protein
MNDNAMGERGLGRVESLFKNSDLQRLYLSNCGLSHYSMVQLNGYLLQDNHRIAKSLMEHRLGQEHDWSRWSCGCCLFTSTLPELGVVFVQGESTQKASTYPLINKLHTMRQNNLQSCPQLWQELATINPHQVELIDEHLCDGLNITLTFAEINQNCRRSC